jgi:hypothetical protein
MYIVTATATGNLKALAALHESESGPSATYIAQVSDPSEDAQKFVNVVVYLPDYPPRFLADQAGQKTHGEVVNGIELRSQDEITADASPSAPSADKTS